MTGTRKQPWASSLAEAKRNAHVDITCPSGTRFTIRPLTLDELAGVEALPDDLLRIALLESIPGGVIEEIRDKLRLGDPESLKAAQQLSQDTLRLRDRIVLDAVVAPVLKAKDVEQLDPFDKQMIAAIAQRRLHTDATGKQVGADPLATFREAGSE